MHNEDATIVFYDGECGFCNKWIGFYFRHRRVDSAPIYFSPTQTELADLYLTATPSNNFPLKSIILYRDGNTYAKSSAVIRIMKNLSFKYRVLANILWLVPVFIRNLAYDLVANNRNSLSSPYCYVPTKEEKSLFID